MYVDLPSENSVQAFHFEACLRCWDVQWGKSILDIDPFHLHQFHCRQTASSCENARHQTHTGIFNSSLLNSIHFSPAVHTSKTFIFMTPPTGTQSTTLSDQPQTSANSDSMDYLIGQNIPDKLVNSKGHLAVTQSSFKTSTPNTEHRNTPFIHNGLPLPFPFMPKSGNTYRSESSELDSSP